MTGGTSFCQGTYLGSTVRNGITTIADRSRCIPSAAETLPADVCFSNRPFRVKRFQTIHPLQCRCRSRARASLRNGTKALPHPLATNHNLAVHQGSETFAQLEPNIKESEQHGFSIVDFASDQMTVRLFKWSWKTQKV